MSTSSNLQEHDMNMGTERAFVAEYVPGQPHPNVRCTRCSFIPDDVLTPEQVVEAVLADMEHWGIDFPDRRLNENTVPALLHANRVVTGLAMTGELAEINNIPGFYIGVAKNYAAKIDKLRLRR